MSSLRKVVIEAATQSENLPRKSLQSTSGTSYWSQPPEEIPAVNAKPRMRTSDALEGGFDTPLPF
jgi:hypothetical protein